MDYIPLSRAEQSMLKKMYKCREIEVKALKQEAKSTINSLAKQGLISDYYNSLDYGEQNKPNAKRGEKFFINEYGERHYIYLRQQKIRFLLPIFISAIALLVSLGTMLINLIS